MLPHVDIYRRGEIDYLLLNSKDHVSEAIRKHGKWCATEITLCKNLIAGTSGKIVIDAGANLGGFTVPVAKILQSVGGSVVCFEPQRVVFQQLCANTFFNRLDNVYPHNVALGDESTTIEIPELDFAKSMNVGGFSVSSEIRQHVDRECEGTRYQNTTNGDNKTYTVKQQRLDDLEYFENVAFIKVDIEGLELEFFRGAEKTIIENRYPPIVFELWEFDWYKEKAVATTKLIEDMGYELTHLGREILAQHPEFGRRLVFTKNNTNVTVNLVVD